MHISLFRAKAGDDTTETKNTEVIIILIERPHPSMIASRTLYLFLSFDIIRDTMCNGTRFFNSCTGDGSGTCRLVLLLVPASLDSVRDRGLDCAEFMEAQIALASVYS